MNREKPTAENTLDRKDKWALIDAIIERELKMFQAVNSSPGSGRECQQRPDTFRLMRWMHHSVLSVGTLGAYLEDLEDAHALERNLVTEKYARMEDQIPALKENPLIFRIAEAECAWMKDLRERYPHVIRGDAEGFRNYLVSELETYSDDTLAHLWGDVQAATVRGLNLPEMRYRNLFKRLGYASLEAVEMEKSGENPG